MGTKQVSVSLSMACLPLHHQMTFQEATYKKDEKRLVRKGKTLVCDRDRSNNSFLSGSWTQYHKSTCDHEHLARRIQIHWTSLLADQSARHVDLTSSHVLHSIKVSNFVSKEPTTLSHSRY